MKEKLSYTDQLSEALVGIINDILKEVVLEGVSFNSRKKWLQRYFNLENADYATFETCFMQLIEEFGKDNLEMSKIRQLASECYVFPDTIDNLLDSITTRKFQLLKDQLEQEKREAEKKAEEARKEAERKVKEAAERQERERKAREARERKAQEEVKKAREEAERQERERKAREERERKAREEERKKKELEEQKARIEAEIRAKEARIKELEEKVRLKEEQEAREERERKAKEQMGHTAIDLGLPSGTKWSSCNLGANKPEELGSLYAWGMTDEIYEDQWISYNERIESNGNNICGTCNDPAWWNLEKEWKMPSREQAEELLINCKYEWTALNGIKGCKFTGPNGKWIFLPAAGYTSVPTNRMHRTKCGSYGDYWTGTRNSSEDGYADTIHFEFGSAFCPHVSKSNVSVCCYGMSIRPVLND